MRYTKVDSLIYRNRFKLMYPCIWAESCFIRCRACLKGFRWTGLEDLNDIPCKNAAKSGDLVMTNVISSAPSPLSQLPRAKCSQACAERTNQLRNFKPRSSCFKLYDCGRESKVRCCCTADLFQKNVHLLCFVRFLYRIL